MSSNKETSSSMDKRAQAKDIRETDRRVVNRSVNQDVLVKVEGLGKKFCKDFSKSLRYGLSDVLRASVGKRPTQDLRPDEFWALKDVAFELRRGDCIGLIGHNGAGKSTLLKVLNGIINPDTGSVEMRGRVGALIELGAGFNPILTGRENIYNNGAVLGFSREDIDSKVDEIIAFSEIGDFIDSPVRNYSSGMKVRLGFAVASHMEPDVLIIDEVLAVGDTGFRLKCFSKLDELLKSAAAIFVSHSMPQVSRMSTQIILLDKGQMQYSGKEVDKGVEMYYDKFGFEKDGKVFDTGRAKLERFSVTVDGEPDVINIDHLTDVDLEIDCYVDPACVRPIFIIVFFDKELKQAATVVERIDNAADGKMKVKIRIPRISLSTGQYSITFNIQEGPGMGLLVRHEGLARVLISDIDVISSPVKFDSSLTVLHEVANHTEG